MFVLDNEPHAPPVRTALWVPPQSRPTRLFSTATPFDQPAAQIDQVQHKAFTGIVLQSLLYNTEKTDGLCVA